jgi:uncharacterized protein YodC (DUF2158 family)
MTLKTNNMSQEFKSGDIVVLKSGGPSMTIEGFKTIVSLDGQERQDKSKVEVSWFESGKLFRETFDVAALEYL